MPYSINVSGSQTRDSSWLPWLEHNSFIIQSYFTYLRSVWECVKWWFSASAHPHERMYLDDISPHRLLKILVHSGGRNKHTRAHTHTHTVSLLQVHFDSQHSSSRQLHTVRVSTPAVQLVEGFIHLVKPVGVIASRVQICNLSGETVFRSSAKINYSHIHRHRHSPGKKNLHVLKNVIF